ncbi:MAG: ABC transporter permease [Bacteroidales bacterium]|nr:ABC transporter permease [Bacteroidales bacterium]
MKLQVKTLPLVFSLLGGLLLLFIVAPLLSLILSRSPNALFQAASEPQVTQSILLSLSVAFLATLFSGILAVPLAWMLARSKSRLKGVISGLIDLPVMIPHSAAGIAVLGMINRESVAGKIASEIGISFVDRPAGIAVAMAFVSVPFLINAARDGFAAVPLKLEKAASSLGAGSWRVFFSISLPLAWRNVLSGFVMMFARGMSEFGAVVIIAYHPLTAPVLIYDRFNAFGLKAAQEISVLFILVSIVVFVALRMIGKNTDHVRS